jgi:hypothetical protein
MIDEILKHDLVEGGELTFFGEGGEQVGVTVVA